MITILTVGDPASPGPAQAAVGQPMQGSFLRHWDEEERGWVLHFCSEPPPPPALQQEENSTPLWEVQVVGVLRLLFGAVLPMRPSPEGTVFFISHFVPFRNYHDVCQERSH